MAEKKRNPHAGHRSRLRKQLIQNGGASFYPHQLLELLLFYPIPRKDTNDLAHDLIDIFDGFDGIFTAKTEDISKVRDAGVNTAAFLKAVYGVYAAYGRNAAVDRIFIDNPFAADAYYSSVFHRSDGEQFAVTALDENSAVFYTDIIKASEPSPDSRFTDIRPVIRRILEVLVKGKCSTCIIAHYMPVSEDTAEKERETVNELFGLLEQLNIRLGQYYYINDLCVTAYLPEC